ncbi:uncharacterized protein V6R79_001045 [Siganus canaliculatus]
MSCRPHLAVSPSRAGAEDLASSLQSADAAEQCEEHGHGLALFCLDDLEPVCKQCAAVSHEGHRVYIVSEAAADCKAELRTLQHKLEKRLIHFEEVTRTCEDASRQNQAAARVTEDQMKREFESLHQFLREEEAARLLKLREKQEQKNREAAERTDRVNQMLKSVEQKIQLIEEELEAGGDGAGFLQRYQNTVDGTWTKEPHNVCKPLLNVAKHLGNLKYTVWEKMKHIAPYTPVTLDPRTAGQLLRVSPGLNSVRVTPGPSQGPEQSLDVAANPERSLTSSCVLAREGFDSGVHCWDVEVGETKNWTVGVAAQLESRGTKFKSSPDAGLWCISLQDGQYRALTSPPQDLILDKSHPLTKIHVRLDWEEGTLTFTDINTEAHVFTFRHGFREKVYPYFESTSAGGSLAVLPRSVDVSVGSGYASEDTAITVEDPTMKNDSCSEGDIIAASTNKKLSERRRLTEDKNFTICSIREEDVSKAQRCTGEEQLVKKKPSGKKKTEDNRAAVRKQGKSKFNVNYHVSLNRALNITDSEVNNHIKPR